MIEEKNTYSNKTELSLSALMFFSPLIQNQMKKRSDINENDKNFIKGFIKIGYLNIFMLILSIGLQIIFYLTNISLIQNIGFVITIILAISLVIGSIYAISNKELIKINKSENEKISQKDKISFIINYIPLYNIHLRYKKHNFNEPDMILKESILVWGMVSILLLVSNEIITWFLVILIVIRIITLINGINLGEKTQKLLDNLFKKNPEESRGYIIGTIVTIFNQKSLQENIETSKNNFKLILKIEHKQILLEYIILFIMGLYMIYYGYINQNISLIISTIFILMRYLVMIVKWKHVPHLPIIKEITNLFFNKNKKRGNQ